MDEMSETLPSRIEFVAKRNPDKPMAIFIASGQHRVFSFRDFLARAARIAAGLKQRGTKPGDLVLIVHETHPDLFSAFLGAMMSGGIPSIMPPPTPKQRPDLFWSSHFELYGRLQPTTIIASPRVRAAYSVNLPSFADRIVEPAMLADAEPTLSVSRCWCPNDLAFLQHSSGTTALKKGVGLTHAATLRHVDLYAHVTGVDSESLLVSWLPYYHDMGLVACFLLPICTGATVAVLDPFEWSARPTSLLEAIGKYKATHAWCPNFAFEHLCNAAPNPSLFDLNSLRALINCSEPCRHPTQERFTQHFAASGLHKHAIQVCYAMAENVFAVTQTKIGEPVKSVHVSPDKIGSGVPVRFASESETGVDVVSCGTPLPNVQLSIVDEDRVALDDLVCGEVAIATTTLFDGYYRRRDLTDPVLETGRYFTGDYGFTHKGELFIVGRKDDMIIAYGRNFLAYEVEAVANRLEGVVPGRTVVFSVESDRLGTREMAVMCEGDGTIDAETLSRSIRTAIDAAAGLTPRHIVIIPRGTLAKTTSGKISRSANRELFLREFTVQRAEIGDRPI